MKYVIGIDLGTSAVKTILVNDTGEVICENSKSYPLIQEKSGYSEQDPEQWIAQTKNSITELVAHFKGNVRDIEGISFSGQMHGLVLLDLNYKVLRNAILWNDTRTSPQCKLITEQFGEQILKTTRNRVLEGFTLPKIVWVKENEQEIFNQTSIFLLPKDYIRFRLTGDLSSECSDAAGTLLLDIAKKEWNIEICKAFEIPIEICPPLVESHSFSGTLLADVAREIGLSDETKVFAGGADNACGALGAGILSSDFTLCSIGTSGVVLTYEDDKDRDYGGRLHFFNHVKDDSFYSMGVTLSAGQSLTWFKENFAKNDSFQKLLEEIQHVPIGCDGLMFTPYLFGERTPHADATIRGTFLGIDGNHRREHFVRAIIEGITFSLNESIQIFRDEGKAIENIISIGGGAKSDIWLQIQADIFNAKVLKIKSEQGPGLGAAMLAAYGCGWFKSLDECAKRFINISSEFHPNPDNVKKYSILFNIYREIYSNTKELNQKLVDFRMK
ncbi:xylulokinase [Bacillus canaveralius]|uniref:Xylulose kinase n=1 Tax=Bacillus canaveralius TaxID=1403243 RepID=A0A2N5GI73_9BACI|nr:xylulokinase [Bacillus canaveralius]PLR80550.1 xylulokinase [Bacillus canaveralius]PLR92498.1 xylulokinase [Bacillus canaveralius]